MKNTNMFLQDIEVYNPEEDQWDHHCKAPCGLKSFSMAMMNGQLVLAGGTSAQRYSDSCKQYTEDKVAVWNETSQRLGSIPIPLCLPLAAVHG